jgi:hypothetical protein
MVPLLSHANPTSQHFCIHSAGVVRTRKRIDYEAVKRINFTVIAYDSGIPQKSAAAYVNVNVININDMDPVFSEVCTLLCILCTIYMNLVCLFVWLFICLHV